MSSSCCLAHTDKFCLPTQWFVVDATHDHRIVGWIKSLTGSVGTIDYLRVPIKEVAESEQCRDLSASEKILKEKYIALRPLMLEHLHSTFNQRRRGGPTVGVSGGAATKGRLVVWIFGELCDEFGRVILEELPTDITSLIYWKIGLKPAVFRVAIGDDAQQKNIFLNELNKQYFHCAAEMDSLPVHVRSFFSNEYDSCLLADDETRLKEVVSHLLQLHVADMCTIKQHVLSAKLGPNELLVMDSEVRWRKVNWMAIAHAESFPRLWRITAQPETDESRALLTQLDAEQFDQEKIELRREPNWNHLSLLEEVFLKPYLLGEEDYYRISFGDERTRRELIQYLQRTSAYEESLNQIHKVREQWEESAKIKSYQQENTTALKQFPSSGQSFSYLLKRTISTASMLYRSPSSQNLRKTSADGTRKEDNDILQEEPVPPIYLKLEGTALLKLGREEEAKHFLGRYIETLQQQEEAGGGLSATQMNEIATVAIYEKNFTLARIYALKAIALDKTYFAAYRTLIWITQQSGNTTYQQEETIFSFLMNAGNDDKQAEEYYRFVQQKWPSAYFAMAFFGILLSEVKLKKRGLKPDDVEQTLNEAEQAFRQACQAIDEKGVMDEKDAWVLGNVATFLYQHRYRHAHHTAHQIKSQIEALYWRALSADSSNVVWQVNMGGFLLACGRKQEGKKMLLEKALPHLEEDNDEQNSGLALELWFYIICHNVETPKKQLAMDYLRKHINAGVRSHGWNLDAHLDVAHSEGHPDVFWLQRLAQVITQDLPPAALDLWPAWNPPHQSTDHEQLLQYSPKPLSNRPIYSRKKKQHVEENTSTQLFSSSFSFSVGEDQSPQKQKASLKLKMRERLNRKGPNLDVQRNLLEKKDPENQIEGLWLSDDVHYNLTNEAHEQSADSGVETLPRVTAKDSIYLERSPRQQAEVGLNSNYVHSMESTEMSGKRGKNTNEAQIESKRGLPEQQEQISFNSRRVSPRLENRIHRAKLDNNHDYNDVSVRASVESRKRRSPSQSPRKALASSPQALMGSPGSLHHRRKRPAILPPAVDDEKQCQKNAESNNNNVLKKSSITTPKKTLKKKSKPQHHLQRTGRKLHFNRECEHKDKTANKRSRQEKEELVAEKTDVLWFDPFNKHRQREEGPIYEDPDPFAFEDEGEGEDDITIEKEGLRELLLAKKKRKTPQNKQTKTTKNEDTTATTKAGRKGASPSRKSASPRTKKKKKRGRKDDNEDEDVFALNLDD